MATGDADRYGSPSAAGPRSANVARTLQRFGLVAALVGVLPLLVTGAAVLARSGGSGVVVAVTAGAGGVASALRVAVGVTAAGTWCAGLGLLVEGLFPLDA